MYVSHTLLYVYLYYYAYRRTESWWQIPDPRIERKYSDATKNKHSAFGHGNVFHYLTLLLHISRLFT